MKFKKRVIPVILLALIMLLAFSAAAFADELDELPYPITPDGETTTMEYVASYVLRSIGMKESALGEYPRDHIFMAKSVNLLDGVNFEPKAECGFEDFLKMTENARPLFNALRAQPMEPFFVNGMAQPIFPYDEVVRFCVYVESDYDTDADGKLDLVKALVQLPKPALEGMKVGSVFEARPYIAGTNGQSIPSGYEATSGEFDLQSLYTKVPPRIPAGEATSLEVAASANPDDWYYLYGTSRVFEDLTWYDYYIVRGFAVIESAGIGTMGSEGLSSCGADIEIEAFRCVIEWLGGERKAYTDKTGNIEIKADWSNGNVGMTGRSYAGTTQFGLAATGVKALKTIVPVAGIASWYEYTNVQGVYNSLEYTQGLAWHCNSRYREPDYNETIRDRYALYLRQMRMDQRNSTGDYCDHWAVRDYTLNWDKISCPALIVHGVNDDNVRSKQSDLMYQAYVKANQPVKMMWHQGQHMTPTFPSSQYEMYIDEYLYDEILNMWFSHYLFNVENGVENMPNVISQSNVDGSWHYFDSWQADNGLIMKHADPGGSPTTIVNSNYSGHTPAITSSNYRNYFLSSDTPHNVLYTMKMTKDTIIKGAVEVHVKAAPNIWPLEPTPMMPISSRLAPVQDVYELGEWSEFLQDGVFDWEAALAAGLDNDTAMMLGREIPAPPVPEISSFMPFATMYEHNAEDPPPTISRGDNLVMSALLVDVSDSNFMTYAFGSGSASTTMLERGGAWMGGGVRNYDLVKFAQANATSNALNGTYYKAIAYGMVDLYNPAAGYDSAGADRDKRVQLVPGEYYDYTIYLMPSLYYLEAGHTLALVLMAQYPSRGPGQPTAAQGQYCFTVDNAATYAYIPLDVVPTFDVTFLVDGKVYDEQIVELSQIAQAPAQPSKDGFNFDGWRIGGEDGELYNFNAPIIDDIQLFAAWKAQAGVSFPGLKGVTMQYYTNVSGWVTVGVFDDACSFEIPQGHKATWGVTTLRVVKDGMYATTTIALDQVDNPIAWNVPLAVITVTGVTAQCNLAIIQNDWVYRYAPAAIGASNTFLVFNNDKKYEIRLQKPGAAIISITGINAGQTINVGSYI